VARKGGEKKMADGFYKPVLCKMCGKPMKFSNEWGYIPLEVTVALIERGYPWTTLMHYTCSDKHKRAWYIPSLGDREEVLIYQNYPIG
jgi:hypothetical protein